MARVTKKTEGIRWRLWIGLAGLGVVCVSTAMAALEAHRYATTNAFFALSPHSPDAITVQGLQYTPRWKVLRVFENDFGRSVFAIPLAERRRRLMAINWVWDASVSRVMPNRLVVRIRERKPVAFAMLRSGAMLVDAEGVLMEPPTQGHFAFPVLNGLNERETEAERRVRVETFLRFQLELGEMAGSISEVNVSDPTGIRAEAQIGDHTVELMMGSGDFARRYENFLRHYQEIAGRTPEARRFDLTIDDRITARD